MWVVPFIVEGCTPPEVIHRDLHGLRQTCTVLQKEGAPVFSTIVSKSRRIFSAQRKDDRPDRAMVFRDLCHHILERHILRVTEQAMVTALFYTGTGSYVLEVAIASFHGMDIGIQCHGDQFRGVAKGGRGAVITVLE